MQQHLHLGGATKMIELTLTEWKPISDRLLEDCPLSWTMIRSVQKRELGFTVRYHQDFDQYNRVVNTVCLDFYDDAKETWFRMKYL